MDRLERIVRNAYEIGLMMHEDFPEIKRGLINGKTLEKLTNCFMCQIRYGFYPIYEDKKLEKYSQQKKVIQKAIKFSCYGYDDNEEGNYNLEDFEGTLTEGEKINIRKKYIHSAKEKKLGIYGLSSHELREQGLRQLEKTLLNRKNLLTDAQKSTFFKLWHDKRYQYENGNPNFIKIGKQMNRKPGVLRSFYTRFKKESGIRTKQYINWEAQVVPIKEDYSISLIDFVQSLIESGKYTTTRNEKPTLAYKELTNAIHSNLPEYESKINPENLRQICNRREIRISQ